MSASAAKLGRLLLQLAFSAVCSVAIAFGAIVMELATSMRAGNACLEAFFVVSVAFLGLVMLNKPRK